MTACDCLMSRKTYRVTVATTPTVCSVWPVHNSVRVSLLWPRLQPKKKKNGAESHPTTRVARCWAFFFSPKRAPQLTN